MLLALRSWISWAAETGGDVRVLFITDNFPPESNAPAIRTWDHVSRWAEEGVEVTVLTGAPNFPTGRVFPGYRNRLYFQEQLGGVRVIRVWTFVSPNKGVIFRALDYLSFAVSAILAGAFMKRRDIVIATSPQFFAAIAGACVALIRGSRFVLEIRDIWPASIEAVGAIRISWILRVLEKIELALYKFSDGIVTVTESARRNLVRRGVSASKVTVVYNGVDPKWIQSAPSNEALARTLQLEGKFVIGYIGTMGMAHDLSQVLDAAKLVEDLPTVRFLFVGTGAKKDDLERFAREKQISNVTFVPRQPHAEIPTYWKLCKVGLISLKDTPLFSEVIPSKMFEAICLGLPVIMYCPKGEATQIVLSYGCGMHAPAGNPKALASAIRSLVTDPDLCRTMSENSLRAAPNHDRKRQAQNMLRFLERFVEPLKKAA